ncbi:MAG: transcription factor S [Candidatus Woesearchaeota archaeon]
MFCPKCRSLLLPKKEKGKKVLACSCGHSQKSERLSFKEELQIAPNVEVVLEETNVLPKTEALCQKCGHNAAFYWTVQTRAGDEPETKFLKCEKCKHTWRDYS